MRKTILAAIMLIILGAASSPVWAWNSIGHMAVAYLAYQRLSPAEKARVAVLLKLNPNYSVWLAYIPAGTSESDQEQDVFMMAATWPDEIKAMRRQYTGNDNAPAAETAALNLGYSDMHAHRYWHFVDTPFGDEGSRPVSFEGPTATEKITVFRAALGSDAPDALKSYDLVWLLHLVGDVHQPLHCSTRITTARPRGDYGGNLVLIAGPARDLHALWDGALGAGATKDFMTAAKAARALPAADAELSKDDKEEDWAAESFALVKTSVYVDPVGAGLGPFTLSDEYSASVKRVAGERIALAGARLGNLIKEALQCGETSCAH